MSRHLLVLVLLAAACGTPDVAPPPADELAGDGKADAATHLEVELSARRATARIELERAGDVTLEAGGLHVTRVSDRSGDRSYTLRGGALHVRDVRGDLTVEYGFDVHDHADGLLGGGSTVTWPYFCGNLFPCHSQPEDGQRFSLSLRGAPAGQSIVAPSEIDADAPPYMLAWAVGDYQHKQLGSTAAGTEVSVYWLARGERPATTGTAHLVEIFDWYEQVIGPYAFGDKVAAVSVVWGEGMYGGMEHHPFWHVARDAMNDPVTHAHEAAHGWFGDGIRLRCWEDFVLSEGTVTYLAARATGQVEGADAEAKVWREYQRELDDAIAEGGAPAWPRGCNQIDILKDKLFTNLPYMEGAFFYKDVAAQVGADRLDGVLHDFYLAHAGEAAGMQQMVDAIRRDTGFDPSPLVEARLRRKFK